ASVAALFGLVASVSLADDTTLKVKVGDKFPDLQLKAAQVDKVKKDAKTISISDLKGKNVVVFFYPKADTPGCTVESCGFRDKAEKFAALDTVAIGISTDTVADQQKFTDKFKLTTPLFADADKKVAKAYGVLNEKGRANRWTF